MSAFAGSNQSLIYQGRITRPDGSVINAGAVQFTLSVYSPLPSRCLLYSETQSVNMTGSGGMFSLPLGSGTRTDGGAHAFSKIFINGGTLSSLTCASGNSYSPAATDDRSLVVSFNDNGTVVQLSSMEVKSVPFALQAAEIGGYGINDIVKIHPTTGSATTFTVAEMAVAKVITSLACANNEIIKYNGTTWACSADATGGSPSDASYAAKGIVQFDTNAATSGITVAAGVAKLSNTGVAANSYGSATKVGTFTVDAQGRITSASDANIAIPPSQITQGGAANGEVLKWNGTNWVPSSDLGTTTDASYAAKGIVQFNTDAATSGISIAAGVATVNTGTGANQIVKLDGTGKLPAVDGSALTGVTATSYSGTLPIANGGTNSNTALNNDRLMISSGGKIVEAPAMTNGQIMIGSTGAAPTAATLGQSNGISITNGAGTISIATNATSANTASTIVSRDASGNFNAGTGSFSSTQLRGSTSGTLTFTVPTTVTDYTIRWPGAVGAAGSFLTTDASGNLSWGSPAAISDASYAVKGAVQFDTNAATSGISISSGVASVNTGTGANQIVKLDGSGKLPAVDGSALTGLTASQIPDLDAAKITSGVLPIARGGTNNGSLGVTAGGVVYGDGSKLMMSAAGTSGQALISAGAGTPAFGNLGVSGGGTGATSFSANQLVGTNGTGTAQVSVTCAQNQVISFDASGNYGCYNVSSIFEGFVNGGNTVTATAVLGTNSNHNLEIETNGATRMTVSKNGDVGLGTTNPSGVLDISGTRNGSGTISGATTSITGSGTAFLSELAVGDVIVNVGAEERVVTAVGSDTAITINSAFAADPAGTAFTIKKKVSLGSGNVTIGTSSPTAIHSAAPMFANSVPKLEIQTGSNNWASYSELVTIRHSNHLNTANARQLGFLLKLGSEGTSSESAKSGGLVLESSNIWANTPSLSLVTANARRMTIDYNGNMGVGATDPSTILDVNGAITQRGMAAPSASPAGQGRIYFDSTANKFKVSQNGAAYVDLVPGATADASYATKGIVQFDTNAATSGISVASGVASVNAGTGANQIVKLDGSAKLPAVDGSALTGLTASQIPDLDAAKITSGVLPIARGGTNNGSLGVTAGGVVYGDGSKLMMSAAGTSGQALISAAAGAPSFGTLGVGGGGTGLTAGTSGGIPYFSAANTMASSAALTANGVVLGGGAGAAPTSTAAGAAYSVLRVPSGGGAPVFGAIDLSQSAAVTGTLPVGSGGTGASSIAANRLVGTNGTGTAMQAVTCSQNQVLSFDASGNYGCYNVGSIFTGFVDGGNTFTATATLGTNSNHDLEIETNGTTKMTVQAGGNVGIGTTAPGALFDVRGQARVANNNLDAGLTITNWSSNQARFPGIILQNYRGAFPGGNTILGQSFRGDAAVPAAAESGDILLELKGSSGLADWTSNESARIGMYASGTATSASSPGYIALFTTPSASTTPAERVRIDKDGNVGIGTTNPGATLHVNGPAAFENSANSSAGPTFSFWKSRNYTALNDNDELGFISFYGHGGTTIRRSGYIAAAAEGAPTAASTPGRLTFHTTAAGNADSTERMRISSTGNIGIGNTDPNTILDISGAFSQRGMAAPAVSVAGQGRIYFDSTANKFKVSQNGGAYSDLVPASTSDASYAAKGVVQFDTNAATSGISIAAGVASVNTGTGANQIVKLDGSSRLPAVDGSNLTNLDAGDISAGVLPIARGGTNNGSLGVTAGGMIYADGSKLMTTAAGTSGQALISAGAGAPAFGTLGVGGGGTGLTSGTSGGIPYYSAASTMASSAALTQYGVVLGGGAGAAPTSTAAGAAYSVLRVPSGGGAPVFGAIDLSQSAAVTGTLTVGNGGTGNASAFSGNALIMANGTGSALISMTCLTGQILKWNSTAWACVADSFSEDANNNIVVGTNALSSNTNNSQYNVALGYDAQKNMRPAAGAAHNISFGYGALRGSATPASNTGTNNFSAGVNSMVNITSASNNMAVGNSAMGSTTTGSGNIALGNSALFSNTTGSHNVALGSSSQYNMRPAASSYNISFGYEALMGSGTPASNTGINNFAAGYQTLKNLTTGSYNVGFGLQSLFNNSTGNNNLAMGSYSLLANTTGENNIAFGWQALMSNETANNNIALGAGALQSNKISNINIAIGLSAQQNMQVNNGSDAGNIAIGREAIRGSATPANNTGTWNIGIGDWALQNVTSGSINVAIGNNPLQNTTTGLENVAIGNNPLILNTTGNYNVALGSGTLSENTVGASSTAVGPFAQELMKSAGGNTAVGGSALRGSTTAANNTGVNNTAVGYASLYSNSSGNQNAAMGYGSMYLNTTGSENVAIGREALYSSTASIRNVAIGTYAQYYMNPGSGSGDNIAIGTAAMQGSAVVANNTGTQNIAIGQSVMEVLTSGSGNVGLGDWTFFRLTTGSRNTAIGYYSGYHSTYQLTSGNYNTFVGALASLGSATQRSYATAIGYDAKVDASSTIVLGRAADDRVVIGATGTANTTYKFHVTTDATRTTIGGNAAWTNSSDARYKTNVAPIKDALGIITKLQGVRFDWDHEKFPNQFENARQIGFIAQQIEPHVPEIVKSEPNGYKAVQYSQLVAVLTEAVKELYAKWIHKSQEQDLKIENMASELKKKDAEIQMLKSYLCQKDPKAAFCQ